MKLSFLPDSKYISDSKLSAYIESSSTELAWLKDIRLSAFSNYVKQSLPTRKAEHWKYNDMSFLPQSEFELLPKVNTSEPNNSLINNSLSLLLKSAIKLVLIDGHYSSELSSGILNSGIVVTQYSDANKQQQQIISSAINAAHQDKNLLISLSSATAPDGILIDIQENKKIDQPVYILHLTTSSEKNKISTDQLITHCGKNSECQLVEHFLSDENLFDNLSLQQTIIHLQENSQCKHTRLNIESENTKQVSRVLALLEKNSVLNSFYYSEGSKLNRTDIDIHHQGQHSKSQLTGIYLPSKSGAIDYHTNIEHRVANCTSREIFRGIIADSAKATFNGKIHIFKDAQKSDAQLSNKNLLLTNQAEINTKPELEIYADDVVCAHGATVAKIDETAVFYLQTRGIDEKQAKKMLSVGFINELVDKVDSDMLNQYLLQQIHTRLADIK